MFAVDYYLIPRHCLVSWMGDVLTMATTRLLELDCSMGRLATERNYYYRCTAWTTTWQQQQENASRLRLVDAVQFGARLKTCLGRLEEDAPSDRA